MVNGSGTKRASLGVGARLVEHRPALRAFLARRLRDHGELEDYVQDVYVRALAAAPGSPIHNLRGYLFRIASSVLVDKSRRDTTRKRDRHVALEQAFEPDDGGSASPEAELSAKERLAMLRRELETLTPVARDCFVLVRLDGLRPAEAAQRLGLTEKAVTRHLERTMAKLAKILLETS